MSNEELIKKADIQQIAEQGAAVYEKIKDNYEPKENGKFLAIDIDSGDAYLGSLSSEAVEQARQAHPDRVFYVVKIGFSAAEMLAGGITWNFMGEQLIQKIISLFADYREIKLVYLFGSTARNNRGPLSDIDLAVYLDGIGRAEMSKLKLELLRKFSDILKTDQLDLVILNLAEQPELKYQIITEGKLIYEQEPYRVMVEPLILNEYFDFQAMLKHYGLTRA